MSDKNQTIEEIVEPINTGPLDVIGTLYNATEDGEAETLPGWHVNSPYPIEAFAGKQVTPSTPRRVFGGVETVFYTFDSEAEFLELLAGADLSQPVDIVPKVITKRQATRVLHEAGLLAKVEAVIAQSPAEVQLDWAAATVIERAWPALAALAPVLGLSDEALDALFVVGAGL